jgi:3',5'-cyclic AMP phosphodiesterase CpdA
MHISDLHAGRTFHPQVAEQLAREAHDLHPDLVIVSGDLVQRADFTSQWEQIVQYLQRLPEPRLIIPGNHDVPLFHLFERFFRPLDRYRRYISSDLNPVFERPGLVVVGGHHHVAYVDVAGTARKFIVCQSGTSASRRIREGMRGKNAYNVLMIEDSTIHISQRGYVETTGRFEPFAVYEFQRRGERLPARQCDDTSAV